MENLCGKLNILSFMSYIDKFDVACLTETFADSTFDFSRLFTGYVKFAAPAKKTFYVGQKLGRRSAFDSAIPFCVCEET